MSLINCLKKAGTNLRAEDKTAILASARQYRTAGMNADEAGLMAIDDQIRVIQELLKNGASNDAGKNTSNQALRQQIRGQSAIESVANDDPQDPVVQRAEAARTELQRKAKASRLRGYTYDKSPFLAFLGKHGVALSRKADFSPDKNPMLSGYGPMFRQTGKNTDLLLQNAIEENYLPEGADTQALEELIDQQISGMGAGQTRRIEAIYNPDVADRVMNERMDEAQQAYQEELAAQQEAAQNDDLDPFSPLSVLEYSQDDAASSGYNEATQTVQLEVNALLLTAEKLGIDTDEIKYQAHDETRSGTQQDYLEAARAALKSAIAAVERSHGDSGANAGQPGNEASQEGLTAPTPADILAQQQAKTDGEKANASQRKAEQERLRRDAERKDIAKASEAAADTFELGGNAEQNLSGQGGMFDEPARTPKQRLLNAKPANDDELIVQSLRPGSKPVVVKVEPTPSAAGYKILGKNADGQMLEEDANGVRSYVESGVRVREKVGLLPSASGVRRFVKHEDEFLTTQEAEKLDELEAKAKPLDVQATIKGAVSTDNLSNAQIDQIAAMFDKKPEATATKNTIFTEDAAAAARAILKKKLGTAMSGIDPELLQAGITLAGYHIEKGARTFAAYAQAMVDDLGDTVKPYLKSWYMGVKYDPRAAAFDGMDTPAVMESVNLDEITSKADTQAKDNANAKQQLDRPSTGTLAGASAEEVRTPEKERDAGEGSDRRSGGDGLRSANPDGPGGNVAGGLGADAGALPVPAGRAGADAKNAKKPRVSRNGGVPPGSVPSGDARGGLTPDAGANPAPNAPQIAAPQPAAEDFTITDELALGVGGQKTKFKNNIAAIKLVRDLESSGRMATPDEQKVLAKYVGWGGIAQAFDAKNADWAKEYAEITALMSGDELDKARQSTRYAHYTSREIIVDGIYAAMRQFGFTGGRTLEAGAGVGNFIGLMPAHMRSAGRFTAIEREPFSSAIARQLYPQQNVQRADFTEFKGTDAYFDAAVGNPPFASDPQTDRSGRKHLSGLSLHNYFFAKNIDMLREGGIMAQVVTNSFLDAVGDKARKYISDRAELLGAIRLPNNAFAKNAGTEVTTDIIFLKKRPDGEVGGKAARADAQRWLNIGKYTDKNGKQVALNQYFIDNPGMMLGDFGTFGTMYGPEKSALVTKPGQDTLALLKQAVGRLPAGVYKSITDTGTGSQIKAAVMALKSPSVKEGGYFVEGDKLVQRLPDIAGEARGVEITPETQWTEKTKLGEPGFERIKSLAAMRTTVRGLLAAEMSDNKMGMLTFRVALNKQYDQYRQTHGLLNDPGTLRVFDDDPDFPLLASLEHGYTPGIGLAAAKRLGVKPTASTAKKGPIFTQRVVAARQTVQKVETPADALAVSMAERGKLDAAYIGTLLGMESEAVLKELSTGDKPLLFRDPATDEFVLRDAYLSGNVRAKLVQAKHAGVFTNISALEAVQPEDVGSHEITARLGSPWVPTRVYEDFAQTLYGENSRASVSYRLLNSSFQLSVTGASELAIKNTWGTPEFLGGELLQAIMNNRTIKVTERDSEGKTYTNVDATERANTKAQEIKEKFNDWLFSDPERSELLTKAYNETNNNYVTRVYDGSNMNFPGKVPDSIIKFRRHQRNAIARIVQDRTALLDHVVGAGKTFTVISGAMELKRTGLARKPMVAVPNHLVKQWAADFYRLYPGANVLTATKKDFEKGNRRKFLARIATGDWDAVVIAHSSYGFIKPSPEFETEFNQREIRKIMATIQSVEADDGDKQSKKRTIKQLEGMKERLENRIKALRDKPMDDLLDFEQIGVDQLFVDEAHCFPAGTMVTTKTGAMPIDEIVKNRLEIEVLSVDLSISAPQWKKVSNWFTNRMHHTPVRITHDAGVFECTSNHKIWTLEDGYVAAADLKPTHTLRIEDQASVWATSETGSKAVRTVRAVVPIQVIGQEEQRQTQVLRQCVRCDMEDDAAAHQIKNHGWPASRPGASSEAKDWDEKPGIFSADAGEQPHEESDSEGKNGGFIDGPDISGAGRKWEVDSAAADDSRCNRVADGTRDSDGIRQAHVCFASESLQGGSGRSGQDARHRGGWEHAQAAKMEVSGCTQDRGFECSRVVSVEILEQGSDGRSAVGFEPDSNVYCLEVEDNHNFFAEGVLVSNCFKNLLYTTKMQGVAGLNDPTGSQRAYDMYVKTNQVMEKNGRGQGVVFATGTPVSNSLAEMYHMMRYLMPAQMKELGFESFDAWANTYASVEQVWMQAPSGDGFKAQNRMSNFVNTPELLKMFDQVSDTVTMDDIKKAYSEENNGDEFPLPKLKGGRRTPVSLEKSAAQNAYMDTIAERAKEIEKRRGPPEKGDDNILVVMSDARKAAMDIRLVDPSVTKRETGGRIDLSTDQVVARHKQFDAVKGTQLVFSDMGTPLKNARKELTEYEAMLARVQAGNEDVATSATLGNEAAISIMEDAEAAQAELDAMGSDWLSAVKSAMRGFSVYDDFKAALIEKGVPEAEIAFIHDANTDDQKAALFRKVNAGQIRVLLGSTAKMGAGTNVQERLVALHHLDVPWRPSDVEQREGRIERQGNLFATPPTKDKANPHHIPGFEIEILAYVTRDTLDMRMWQVQETKLKMINQLRTRKIGREIDNAFEDMELSAGEMQAAATGDINLLKEIQLRNDVKKLEQRRRSFDGQRNDLIARKRRNAEQLRDLPKKVKAAEAEATFAEQYKSDLYAKAPPFKMNIDGKDYSDAKEAQEYLRAKDEATEERTDLAGEVTLKKAPLSVTIDGELIKNRNTMGELLSNALGDAVPIMWAVNGETYRRRTVLANAMRQNVLNALADESVQQVGTIGAYSVAVEGSTDKSGSGLLEVTMRRDGDVKLSNQITVGESSAVPARVIFQVENLMQSVINEANYLERALSRAQKDAAELDKAPVAGDWPDQPRLDAARIAHKDVLAVLKKKDAPAAAGEATDGDTPAFSRSPGVVYSQGSPVAPGKGVTLERAQEVADKILKSLGLGSVVQLQVTGKPSDVGLTAPAGIVPTGVTVDGKIYLFADNMGDDLTAFKVVFHELFHLGLSKNLPQSQYIQRMSRMLLDPTVRKYAARWKLTEDGVNRKKDMPVGNWQALAVEEALSDIAEDLNTGQSKLGSKDVATWVRNTIRWLADMAKDYGFDSIAQQLRAMTYTQAEAFVQEIISRAGAAGPVQLAGKRFSQGTSAFKKWFGASKVVDADGMPLVVYHGSAKSFDKFSLNVERNTSSPSDAQGFYFTKNAGDAAVYATDEYGDVAEGANLMPVFLRINNPRIVEDGDIQNHPAYISQEQRAKLEASGHDGIVYGDGTEYVVFKPTQIKSATGNNGDFDGNNPDIRFSRSTEEKNALQALSQADVSDPQTGVSTALLYLGQDDSLYQLPRSSAKDMQAIAADKNVQFTIEAESVTQPDGTERPNGIFNLTMPSGAKASITVNGSDVYINVAGLKEGDRGNAVYDVAANYAVNNDLVFKGDPSGLSDAAMRRRLENMLSSAIKYGTTDHLRPHPRQLQGDASIGVPALKWTPGDTLGNIRAMVDVSIEANDYSNPFGATLEYDPSSQRFKDPADGRNLEDQEVEAFSRLDERNAGAGTAGYTTLQRTALFKSLVQSEGARRALLESVHRQWSQRGTGVGSAGPALADAFYSRSTNPVVASQSTQAVEKIVQRITERWKNAPEVVIAYDMTDPRIPVEARTKDLEQRSGGAQGEPEGFFFEGKVYILASQVSSPKDVIRVLLHESLGHFGLRGVFGQGLTQVLNQVVLARRADVIAKAQQYGLDTTMVDVREQMVNESLKLQRERILQESAGKTGADLVKIVATAKAALDKNISDQEVIERMRSNLLQAAEEVLAELAQTRPELGIVKRAIAAIRTWLRDNVPGFEKMAFSDADIIQQFILPARGWVERGQQASNSEVTKVNLAYSFAGSNAAIADTHALSTAQRRLADGEDAQAVRKETGWFKGADGKWRFEISDADAKLNDKAAWAPKRAALQAALNAALHKQFAAEFARNDFLRSRSESPSRISSETKKTPEFKALVSALKKAEEKARKIRADVQANAVDGSDVTVGSVLNHLALFSAYPAIADIAVVFSKSETPGNASYNVNANSITVAENEKNLLAILLHEIQHGIQTMEGFASGGSVNTSNGALPSDVVVRINQLNEEANSAALRSDFEGASRLRDAASRLRLQAGFDGYRRLAGEVEARNTEARRAMTDAERRATSPSETADVADADVIVVYNDTEMQSAPQPANSLPPTPQSSSAPMFSRSTDPSPRSTLSTYTKAATDKLNEVFSHPGKITLWDKTVGSMYHLAERSPPFKRVFTAAQNFINDVSFYANDAANLAPTILPRMEDWRDLAKSPVSAADNKAIAAPLLEGTLAWTRDESGKPVRMDELQARHALLDDEAKAQMLLKKRLVTEGQLKRWQGSPLDIYAGAVRNRFAAAFEVPGVVWSDAELKSMFNLTGEKQADGKMNGQIGLYREFRAATDKSLDNLAKSDLLRFGGKDIADLTDMVMQAKDVDEAAVVLRDYLLSLAGADLSRKVELLESANGMITRADKVNKLKERGYTPLSRFGRYTVDVVVDGERQYFSLFETMADANKMAAQMREEFGDGNVAQGTLSQEEFKQFQGITPESLELFGNMLGLDSTGEEAKDKAFQTYLKLTKTNRSAMKRMIHRKGTDGYSDEMGRVLAAFVYANARQTSAALHMGELGEAVNDIPKSQGELKDHAIGLVTYIKEPREEAYAVRAMMFAQYLGGNIASALVNFTQPFTVSFPYLSQFGGAVKSGAALVQAMKDQHEGAELDAALAQALKNAQEDGVVSPQAIHELQAQAQGRAALRSGDGTLKGDATAAAKNGVSKLALAWGKLFGFAEQVNRRSTFIAAYRMAEAHKPVLLQELASATDDKRANIQRQLSEINDPQAFAYKAVNETQFISNKANKARFARGPIGATLMTFKSYSTNYLELLHRLGTQNGPEGKKAMALMLATLFLMAGASGMPGADDLDDLADFFAQRLGYNWSSKKAKQEFIEELFGKTFAGFVENGITGLPGSPFDLSVRMSMGNLWPGTGILVQKRDNTNDLKELLGPVGDLIQRTFTAGNQVLSGEPGKALLTIAPKAVSNAFKGGDMGASGNYNDAKGYKVIETTPFEAAMKAIGFQPASVAKVQEANFLNQRKKDFYSMRVQDVNARWARGIYEKDQSQIDEARDMLASWNQKNPEQRMNANMAAIVKRVKEMRMSKDERIAQTAPKALRGQLRKDLAEAQAERASQ